MENETVIEGNKLIMFFDGAENEKIDILGNLVDSIKYKDSYYPEWNVPKFNEDWNLLMPIFFKFRDLVITKEVLFIQHDYWVKKVVEAIKYGDKDDSPSKAFIRIIEAIEWYNTQKTNQ